jgi:membrane protein involved in colicin uptake
VIPDFVTRWLVLIGIGVALFGTGFLKGCTYERDKYEALQAKAEAEAAVETQRRFQAQSTALAKYQKERDNAQKDAANSRAAVQRLRDTIAGLSRNPASPQGGKATDTVGIVLGDCAEANIRLASEADRIHAAGQLCEAIYDSLTNKQKVKSFLREAK